MVPGALHGSESFSVHWNPNPEPDIAGYTVHVGTTSGQYSKTLVVANGTSALVSDLAPSTTYYCAVQAYNTSGLTSEMSEEVSATTAGTTAPEITLQDSTGSDMPSGSATLNFGSTTSGTDGKTETITITNSGTANLTGLALSIDGPASSDFLVSTMGASTLPPGSSGSFTVTFHPTAIGSRKTTLIIASNDADENPFELSLSGEGLPEKPLASPAISILQADETNLVAGNASVACGSLDLGVSANAQFLTIKNNGTADLSDLAVTVEGSHASDFTVSTLGGSTIAPGADTTFSVTFKPSGAGARSAILRIVSNDTHASPFLVSLAGNGIATPEIDVTFSDGGELAKSGTPNGFGRVNLRQTSAARSFTIYNRGTADLRISTLETSGNHAGDFIQSGPGKTTLAPGTTTTFTVVFHPNAAGVRAAKLLIHSNAPNRNPIEIPVSGIGVAAPEIEVSTAEKNLRSHGLDAVDFGTVNAGSAGTTRTITIRNTGTADLTGLKVKSGDTSADAFVVGKLGDTHLSPGEKTSFRVTFRPEKPGARSTTIQVSSNDADEARFNIPLTGKAIPVPEIEVRVAGQSPLRDGDAFVTFNGKSITRTFVITNRGHATLKRLSLKKNGIHGEDFTITPLQKTSLKPGKKTSFKVTFNPRSAGIHWGGIQIASNDSANGPFDFTLTGGEKSRSTSKSAAVKKSPSQSTGGAAQPAHPQYSPVISVAYIAGKQYRCITIPKTNGAGVSPRSVQVSCNLIDWFSGPNHTTVIKDNASVLKIRDNTPLTSGSKRHIRLKNRA